jgi:hypothetical protein
MKKRRHAVSTCLRHVRTQPESGGYARGCKDGERNESGPKPAVLHSPATIMPDGDSPVGSFRDRFGPWAKWQGQSDVLDIAQKGSFPLMPVVCRVGGRRSIHRRPKNRGNVPENGKMRRLYDG